MENKSDNLIKYFTKFDKELLKPLLSNLYQTINKRIKKNYTHIIKLKDFIYINYIDSFKENDIDILDDILLLFKAVHKLNKISINKEIKYICEMILSYKYSHFYIKNLSIKNKYKNSIYNLNNGFLEDYERLTYLNIIINEKNENDIFKLFGYDLYIYPVNQEDKIELLSIKQEASIYLTNAFKFTKYEYNKEEYLSFLVESFTMENNQFFISDDMYFRLRGLLSRKRITKCRYQRKIVYNSKYLRLSKGILSKIEKHEY